MERKRKRAFAARLPLVLLVVLGVTACAEAEGVRPQRHVVEITGFEFRPAELHVAVGDTIVWINRDAVPHTATETSDEWDSGALDTDESWSFAAIERGELSYLCTLHPAMTGKVTVE